MTQTTRKGFTLVELLVVIVIIAMLAGLLIPAVNSARARARQTQCVNNQHELAVAFQQYENQKNQLPGYVVRLPVVADRGECIGWPVLLLPNLGRNDLWDVWRSPTVTVADKLADAGGITVQQFTCPADYFAGEGGLSYVVNCGQPDPAYTEDGSGNVTSANPPDIPANGMFFDQYHTKFATPPVRTDRIADGAGQTILFSENIQAGHWLDGCFDDAEPPGIDPPFTPANLEAYIGLVWESTGGLGISEVAATEDLDTAPTNIAHARPSSNHPGGAVVTFCDGHQGFIDEDVDYLTYARLMAPHDSEAPLP